MRAIHFRQQRLEKHHRSAKQRRSSFQHEGRPHIDSHTRCSRLTTHQPAYIFLALFGFTFAHVLPARDASTDLTDADEDVTKVDISVVNGTAIAAGDDDEWTLVLYNAHEKGGQCGGASVETKKGGSAKSCFQSAAKAVCADFSVDAGVASCTAKFDGSKCGGDNKGDITVKTSKKKRGYDLKDDVKFVQVSCKKK